MASRRAKYLAYQKNRKRPHKPTQRRIKSLLYLLEKLLGQFDTMLNELPPQVKLPHIIWERKAIIEKVLQQQHQWHTTGERPKDVIVSMDKGHIRAMVRGKETKQQRQLGKGHQNGGQPWYREATPLP